MTSSNNNTGLFANLFSRQSASAAPTSTEGATERFNVDLTVQEAPKPVMNAMFLQGTNDETVKVVLSLSEVEVPVSEIRAKGMTARDLVERANGGDSESIGTYTIYRADGTSDVVSPDTVLQVPAEGAEPAPQDTVRVEATPSRTGTLGLS